MPSSVFLFDLDGTLLDSAEDILVIARKIAEEYNQPLPDEEYMRSGISGGVGLVLSRIFSLPIDNAFILELRNMFLRRYIDAGYHHTRLFDGIAPMLNQLNEQDIAWGIITNKSRKLSETAIDHFAPLQTSRVLVCGDDVHRLKPHPAGLLHAASQLHTPPHTCLYLGDSSKDVYAAQAAGMKALVAGWGYIDPTDSPQHWQADDIFSSVDDFRQRMHHL